MDQLNKATNTVPLNKRYRYPQQQQQVQPAYGTNTSSYGVNPTTQNSQYAGPSYGVAQPAPAAYAQQAYGNTPNNYFQQPQPAPGAVPDPTQAQYSYPTAMPVPPMPAYGVPPPPQYNQLASSQMAPNPSATPQYPYQQY